MKLALLLLATAFAAVSAEVEPWCRCAAFVTYEHSEILVYEAPEITITSCEDDTNECKTACATQLNESSNNGDLWMMTDHGVTVGQDMCSYLASHFIFFISNRKVYGYYEVCGGAWQYTGVASQQELCCDGGQHDHCVTKKHPRNLKK